MFRSNGEMKERKEEFQLAIGIISYPNHAPYFDYLFFAFWGSCRGLWEWEYHYLSTIVK